MSVVRILIFLLLLVSGTTVLAQEDLTDGLVAHYPFNNGPEDRSGNGLHGVVGGAELTEDRFGNCEFAYLFEESPDLVTIPNQVLNGANSFSVSVWVKTDVRGTVITAANRERNNEFFIFIEASGRIAITVSANPARIGQALRGDVRVNDNEWHHLVATRNINDGVMQLYVDGVLDINSNRVIAGNLLPVDPLLIVENGLHVAADQDCPGGCWDSSQQFRGKLDDVWIFDRVINVAEVEALMNVDESINVPQITLSNAVTSCEEVDLDAGPGFDSYQWSTGETTQSITVQASGTYTVLTTFNGCEFEMDVEVTLTGIPDLQIRSSADLQDCSVESATLSASPGFDEYLWSNGTTGREIVVTESGEYTVTASTACGEREVTTRFSGSEPLSEVFIPNAFTPNGDSKNEYFVVDSRLQGAFLKVVDRWGKLVYENANYQDNWDGGNLTSGVYYFRFTSPCIAQPVKGWVKILR